MIFMVNAKSYENFPLWMVVLSNTASLSIYAIGAYILFKFGIIFSALYLLYCFWIEFRVLKMSCVNCYYYNKVCCFGKGKLCSLLFKKGNAKSFVKKKVSMKDILPDFLVSIFPIIGAVIILITDFSWMIVILMASLVILSFGGSAIIRGSFACKYCKQRKIGCPAEKLFRKK